MERAHVQQLSIDPPITLLHLQAFTGAENAFLSRIPPATAGIYAWYQPFSFGHEEDQFYNDLLSAIRRKKFSDRTNNVGPTWSVTISSATDISAAKQKRLESSISSAAFRSHLASALSLSIYFQSPLYIGRAHDLRLRVEQHLASGSPLRTRLEAIHIDIRQCSLLFLPTPSEGACGASDAVEEDLEDLYEEVFSRLFEPRFSLRYG
jgi:hypothetical protein